MHSENLADHDLSRDLLKARKAACESDAERAGMDNLISFEEKHRE